MNLTNLGVLLIVLGIICAILVSLALGTLLIVGGIVLLVVPVLTTTR
jgi:hypothetical protein